MAISSPASSELTLPVTGARASAAVLLRRALTRHPTLIAGVLVLLLVLIAAVFAPAWWTGDPQALRPAQRLRPPSAERWLREGECVAHQAYVDTLRDEDTASQARA